MRAAVNQAGGGLVELRARTVKELLTEERKRLPEHPIPVTERRPGFPRYHSQSPAVPDRKAFPDAIDHVHLVELRLARRSSLRIDVRERGQAMMIARAMQNREFRRGGGVRGWDAASTR